MGRQEQLEILECLNAIFGEELIILSGSVESEEVEHAGPIYFKVELPLDSTLVKLRLECMLSPEYPETPLNILAKDGLPKSELSALNGLLADKCAQSLGQEFDAFMFAKDWSQEKIAKAEVQESIENKSNNKQQHRILSRKFFWTHHTRRKQLLIYKWAAELAISGRITVSKPGYTFVEGEFDDIKEFTRRNMSEHWKEIKITWEEEVILQDTSKQRADSKAHRLFPDGLKEVSVEEFIASFRALSRNDILQSGTRGAVG